MRVGQPLVRGEVEPAGALDLFLSADANLFAIVQLSLAITLSATFFAALLGMPLGAFAALVRFPGREALIVVLNAFMGLPPVVVGLCVYLLLSRSGPLGQLGLLFTPTAMVIAQTVLISPIVAALTRQVIEDLWAEYCDEFNAMRVGPMARVTALLWDAQRRAGETRFRQGYAIYNFRVCEVCYGAFTKARIAPATIIIINLA